MEYVVPLGHIKPFGSETYQIPFAVIAQLGQDHSGGIALGIGVKDSGFSPNPYSSHFLFFSIYSPYFSFMQAFSVSQSLL